MELWHVGVHRHASTPWQGAGVDARPGHDHEPQVVDRAAHRRDRVEDAAQQRGAHA